MEGLTAYLFSLESARAARYAYGTAFWAIKAQIGTRRQIQAEPKASACIWRQVPYAFYRTTTHMSN